MRTLCNRPSPASFRIQTLLLLCVGAPALAQYPGAAELDTRLRQLVDESVKAPANARKQLDALLDGDAAQKDLLRSRLYPIETVALRIAFEEHSRTFGPEQLLTGEVREWTPRKHEIHVCYGKEKREDWREAGTWKRHALEYDDRIEIRCTGAAYPSGENALAFEMLQDSGDASSIRVTLGVKEPGKDISFVISREHEGRRSSYLTRVVPSVCEAGQPFDISIKVERGRVQAFFGRKKLGEARVSSKLPIGKLHIKSMHWDELEIRGRLAAAPLAEQLAQHKARSWQSFEKNTPTTGILPDWIFEVPRVERDRSIVLEPVQPVGEGGAAFWEAVEYLIRRDMDGLERRLEGYVARGLSGAWLTRLRGEILGYRGQIPEALEQFRQARAVLTNSYHVYRSEIEYLGAISSFENVDALHRTVFEKFGPAPDVLDVWMPHQFTTRRFDVLEEVLQQLRTGTGSPKGSADLYFFESRLWVARHGGPLRPGETRFRAGIFDVRTQVDVERYRRLARHWVTFPEELARLWPELAGTAPDTLVVQVFRDEAERKAFSDFFWCDKTKLTMHNEAWEAQLRTEQDDWTTDYVVRRALVDNVCIRRFGFNANRLLRAGLSENFASVSYGRDEPSEDKLRAMGSSLPGVASMVRVGFQQHRPLVYPYGRVLVRHLGTSTPENRKLLGRLIERCLAGYTRDALLEDPLDAATCQRLDAELRAALQQ